MEGVITNFLGPIFLVLFILLLFGQMAGANPSDIINPFIQILSQVITLCIQGIVAIITEILKLIPPLLKALVEITVAIIKVVFEMGAAIVNQIANAVRERQVPPPANPNIEDAPVRIILNRRR